MLNQMENKKIRKQSLQIMQSMLIAMIEYLIEGIKKSKSIKLSYNDLYEITQEQPYNLIQESFYIIEGSTHQISSLDSMFEDDDPEFKKNDYGRKELGSEDNKMSSKILLKHLKHNLSYVKKDYVKENLKM
jgi:hypothetical protein